jgi:hypothetical protein
VVAATVSNLEKSSRESVIDKKQHIQFKRYIQRDGNERLQTLNQEALVYNSALSILTTIL